MLHSTESLVCNRCAYFIDSFLDSASVALISVHSENGILVLICVWVWMYISVVFLCLSAGCISCKMKKCSERRKHCALAVVRRSQKFLPRRRPLPSGTRRSKFNQLEMVTTFTYKPSLLRIDAHNSNYHGNRPTNKPTDRTDYSILCRS